MGTRLSFAEDPPPSSYATRLFLAARSGRSVLLSFIGIAACCSVASRASAQDFHNARKTLNQYRDFAMQHDGDMSRGRALFSDEQRLGCTKCHSIDGSGSKAGPDLFSIGDQFARREIINAILDPSATIAVGYSTTIVETKSGEQISGVLKQANDIGIELMSGDAQRHRIPISEIQEQRGSSISLMPEDLQAGLSRPEFTDLIEYLVTLKQPANLLTTHRGMPEEIPMLARPAVLRPFIRDGIGFPRTNAIAGETQVGLVWFGQAPGRSNVFLVADQIGKIWCFEKTTKADVKSVFADLTREVFSARGPNGLLGVAFHPQFRDNGKYYLKHQVFEDGKIATVLVERFAAPNRRTDSGKPSRRLLTIVAVAEHHNGGCIEFGPDGFLYFGMGDSAPNHDPQGHGQDLRLLFGKMLRIDVDRCDSVRPYAIPPDNPFCGAPGARPEIWALGLREPWRFSFDQGTGELWVADLGQERGDEVAIVHRGENHGWNVYEGFERFSNQHRRTNEVYVQPIFSPRRKHGTTIVGGSVCRTDPRSSFYGVYIFGDYTSKRIWGLTHEDRRLKNIRHIATCPQSITCFSTDEQGNIYVLGYEGMIYQLDLTTAVFDETDAVSVRNLPPPLPSAPSR